MRTRTIALAVAFLLAFAGMAMAQDFVTPLSIPSTADIQLITGNCDNTGPNITLTGELEIGGLNARLIFKNNVKGTHELAVMKTVDIEILAPGEVVTFAKQPSAGGVGGNPWIYLQFTDSDGNALTTPIFLGRCVQMSK